MSYQNIPIKEENVYKICLTGGPCAGKTSGLSYLSEKLQNQGYQVYIVPEVASMIYQGGGMIDMSNYNPQQSIDFQANLLKTQMQLEECFMKIAKLNNKPSVVLCDRGLKDGSAYISAEWWNKMLQQDFFVKNQLNEIALRDKQYDCVIHLVTAADGAQEHYNLSNEVRHESPRDAVQLDRRLQLAWLGHPRYSIVDNNFNSFQEKLEQLLSVVQRNLGIKGQSKFHKKYLIDTHDKLYPEIPKEITSQKFLIEDTFVSYEKPENMDKGEYIKCRRRTQGNQTVYIWSRQQINGQNDDVSWKKMMSHKEYQAVLSTTDEERQPIVKQRQIFMVEGVQYTLDTFVNVGEGFSVLKVQTESEHCNPQIPSFLNVTRDITKDQGYKIKYLAKKNWYAPNEDEKVINIRKQFYEV